jgi:hypothetical protein
MGIRAQSLSSIGIVAGGLWVLFTFWNLRLCTAPARSAEIEQRAMSSYSVARHDGKSGGSGAFPPQARCPASASFQSRPISEQTSTPSSYSPAEAGGRGGD